MQCSINYKEEALPFISIAFATRQTHRVPLGTYRVALATYRAALRHIAFAIRQTFAYLHTIVLI